MKVRRLLAVVPAAALLLSGCTSLSLTGTDILSPPKATGDYAAIQSMIDKDAKGDFTLLHPTAGSYKNAIIQYDCDHDGNDEAIALYTTGDGDPRILAATARKNTYQQTGVASLPAADIYEIRFADIDGDDCEELIISFGTGSALSTLAAYRISEKVTGSIVAEELIDYVIGDFDTDAVQDILVASAPQGEEAKAKLMVSSGDGFSEKSSCEIDAAVGSYVSLRFGEICDGISGAIADGQLSDGTYTTQLLYYDAAARLLVNPLFLNTSYSESRRQAAVNCIDIDVDGVTEIPVCSLMEHTKTEDAAAVCTLTQWCGYDPELMALSAKQPAVMCDKLGFMLLTNAQRLSTLTARYTGDNAVTLYGVSYNKNNELVLGKELLTVKRYLKSSFDSSLTAEASIYEGSQYTYTYITGENSPFTHEEIVSSFRTLEADNI